MIHRESGRHAKPLRELSARLLEDQLRRLTGASAIIDRRLGPGLQAMSGQRLYRRLGFVRLGDYLTERLGMSLRRCQSVVRCERALTGLPAIAAAFDSGDLTVSRMRVMIEVATPETQELWLARARRFTVRDLMAAARAAKQESVPPPALATHDSATSPVPDENDHDPAAGRSTEKNGIRGTDESGQEDDDPGVNIMFRAPARVVALWHWALDLVRRAAGHQDPAWRCVEYLAAEFLSGATRRTGGDARAGGATSPDFELSREAEPRRDRGDDDQSAEWGSPNGRAVPDALIWSEATAAARDALRPLGHAADPDVILNRHSTPSPLEIRADDPWSLDAHLRGLVRLRQSLAWREGSLLAVIASRRLYLELGAATFSEWCEAAIGMSARRARYLISLDRRVGRLPRIADAYRRGLISWCQTRHLVRIATPETECRWLRYARKVTVRRLEEAVTRGEIDAVAAPPAPEAAMKGPQTIEDERHTCAPTLSFDDRSECSPIERVDRRIAFWVPTDVAALWREALAACRCGATRRLDDWQCLIMMMDSLRRSWDAPADRGWRRRYRIFERDGWRCRVPGCTSRANLNVHHIVFRSRGGGSKDSNLVTLCVGHHQRGIHDGRVRCNGTAPDDLWWELGLRPSGPPLLRCRGDRIIKDGRSIDRSAAAQRLEGADDRKDEHRAAARRV